MLRNRGAATLVLALVTGSTASAQMGEGNPQMAMGAGRMVRGTVTAATADHLTVKTETGELYEVVVTPNTQVHKGRDSMKLGDVHPGDAVGAMGEVDAPKKTVHALFVQVVDAEQLKKAREAMGKTMIAGTVMAIDETKLTIKRADDVVQVIQVDEDTSFRKGGRAMKLAMGAEGLGTGIGGGRGQRQGAPAATPPDTAESLTLADVKVGSTVAGAGSLKNGVFVPTTLAIGEPGTQRQGRRRPEGAAGATTPATTPAGNGTEPKQ